MNLQAVHWDEGRHRWADIASQPFHPAKRAGCAYAHAAVTLDFADTGPTLAGALAASGLKPNFAYQVKLNGKPTYFQKDGDDWANEQLGYAGRWWAKQVRRSDRTVVKEWRSNDDEYNRWNAQGFADAEHDYILEGYLLFDFLVTDAAGCARKVLKLDSSFHVLWKTSQRRPAPNDSAPVSHIVVARAASGWYAEDRPDREVAIYAEWEPGRVRPGQLVLPPGRYNVQLMLTEESFHEREPGSGSWATVLAAPNLAFTISCVA